MLEPENAARTALVCDGVIDGFIHVGQLFGMKDLGR